MCQGTNIAWRCKCSNNDCPLKTDNSLGHLLYYQPSAAYSWCDSWFRSPNFTLGLVVPSCPSIQYEIDERYKPRLCAGCVNCPQSDLGDNLLPSHNRSRISREDRLKYKQEQDLKQFEKWLADKRRKEAEEAENDEDDENDGDDGRDLVQAQGLAKESDGWECLGAKEERGRSSCRAPEQPERSSSADSVRSDVTAVLATSSEQSTSQDSGNQNSAAKPRHVRLVLPTPGSRPRSRSLSTHSHSATEDETEGSFKSLEVVLTLREHLPRTK